MDRTGTTVVAGTVALRAHIVLTTADDDAEIALDVDRTAGRTESLAHSHGGKHCGKSYRSRQKHRLHWYNPLFFKNIPQLLLRPEKSTLLL